MRILKNRDDIEEIEAVLCEVRTSLPIIPFKAYIIYVHNLCS